MCEVLWDEEKGRVEKIYFGLLIQKVELGSRDSLCGKRRRYLHIVVPQEVGFGETLLLGTCGKLSFGVGECSKNVICSRVGLVGVGEGKEGV